MRGSLDEYNREFRPKVRMLDVKEDGSFSVGTHYIECAKPVDEVLDYVDKEERQKEDERISEYVDALSGEIQSYDSVSGLDDVLKVIRSLEVSQDVRDKSIELIERAYEASL